MAVSSTIYGNVKRGQILWTDDFTSSEDDKGVVTATHSFFCHADEVLALTPKRYAPCVRPGWNLLLRTTVASSMAKAGIAKVTCSYKAFIGEDGDFGFDDNGDFTYESNTTLNEEPLETHFRYKDIEDLEMKTIVKVKSGQFVEDLFNPYTYFDPNAEFQTSEGVSSELGRELVDFFSKGIETYRAPFQTWRATFRSKSKPSAATFAKIGQIHTAKGAPNVADDRNWLFVGTTSTYSEGVYTITLEWELSPAGGFNETIYGG